MSQDNRDLFGVSLAQLQKDYQTASWCLAMMVRKAGGSVTITPEDIQENPQQLRLWYQFGVDGTVTVGVREDDGT